MGNIPIVAAVETDGGSSGGGGVVIERMSDRTKIRISAAVAV